MPENVYIGSLLFAGHFTHTVSFQQKFLSILLDVLLLFPCLWRVTAPCFFSLYSRACKNAWHIVSAQDTLSEWNLGIIWHVVGVLWNFNCSKQIGVGGKMDGWLETMSTLGHGLRTEIAPKASVCLNAVDICIQTQWCFFVSFGVFCMLKWMCLHLFHAVLGHQSTKLTAAATPSHALPCPLWRQQVPLWEVSPVTLSLGWCICELPTCTRDFAALSDVTAGFPSEVVAVAVRVCRNVSQDKIGPQSFSTWEQCRGCLPVHLVTQTSIMFPRRPCSPQTRGVRSRGHNG